MRAILIVPPEGDPSGLLHPGRCRVQPPVVVQVAREGIDSGGFHGRILTWVALPRRGERQEKKALPLFWDGQAVVEGCDRASRAYNAATEEGMLALMDTYSDEGALWIAKAYVSHLGGEILVLQ